LANKLTTCLDEALNLIPDPKSGLPQEAFYFVSQLTPMINVDLLIKNKYGHTLLTWREDKFYGPGWHLPGGIIRFKERIEERLIKVAYTELGCSIRFAPAPIHVQELMNKTRDIRGHFISLLFLCELSGEPDVTKQANASTKTNGQWAWHEKSPPDLINAHESFRVFIDENTSL
jgi:ADP-ribose pyrophosphatase YjhB (NUDIX family)